MRCDGVTVKQNAMRYITTDGSKTGSLRQAVEDCYAVPGELWLPERLPMLPRAYFNNIDEMSLTEIAYVVLSTLLRDDVDAVVLKDIVEKTFNYPMPLRTLSGGEHVLELFHGPTMAFKDAGARFLAALVDRFRNHSKINVVVATTGNTGGAVANALSGVGDINVLVLFPRGTLSRAQQAQFTTAAPNVHPIEVAGNISQCKKMAREAVEDSTNSCISANTQNILRILPQIVFFFHAYARLRGELGDKADGFTVSVPCANLSNLTAAVMARRMGLPMGKIVAGCNANDDFARLLKGEIERSRVNRTARPTLASAMDSGFPVNLPRLEKLYDGDIAAMAREISAVSVDDDAIEATINNCLKTEGYTVDPHTAVAKAAAQAAAPSDKPVVILATAHPAKSLDIMTAVTGRVVELPLQFTRFMSKPAPAVKMAPSYAALKKYMSDNL